LLTFLSLYHYVCKWHALGFEPYKRHNVSYNDNCTGIYMKQTWVVQNRLIWCI
jgi:hypothetical protein